MPRTEQVSSNMSVIEKGNAAVNIVRLLTALPEEEL